MKIETELFKEVEKRMAKNDPAHDYEHVLRVYRNSQRICKTEKASSRLVLTAALLHDIVSFKKSDRRTKNSSTKSSLKAKKMLQKYNYSDNEVKLLLRFLMLDEQLMHVENALVLNQLNVY